MNNFKITKKSKISKARLGVINTEHGKIKTPFFMPDATRATVKGLGRNDLKNLGLQAMVINTYHLYLQPGMPVVQKAKGVHQFMNWQKPLLSDSGGYQVYSLIHKNKAMGKITDKEVIFKSPLDGSLHHLTPEKSIQIQFDLKSDMIVCLDDCPPNDLNDKNMVASIERTIKWAKRCKAEYEKLVKKYNRRPLLFGVIQGGTNLAMRKSCAEGLLRAGFDGYGYGARPVDVEGKFLDKILDYTADLIPENNLRFGLGIGLPEDIVACVKMGWDMFDCVIPTREGRHGRIFLWKDGTIDRGNVAKQSRKKKDAVLLTRLPRSLSLARNDNFYKTVNITNAKFKKDFSPINENSKLPELRNHSKAYLYHLFKTNEVLGARLASLNNLEFYLDLMKEIRQGIRENRL